MRVKKLLILFAGLLALQTVRAQDIHFTQYNMSPMTLNPANIGGFNGTIRVGGIYREQWRSVIGGSRFTTPSAWVDAPVIRGFRKRDWIGVGFMLFQDKAGDGGLSHGAAKFGAAYHFALDKKGNTYLTLGAHYGGEQRKTDINKYYFEDGIIKSGGIDNYDRTKSLDQNGLSGGNSVLNARYTDIDAGIALTSKLNKTTDVKIGVAMYHITRPNYSLLTGGTGGVGTTTSDMPRRLVVHGQFNTDLNKKLSFNPTFLFQSMSGADEIVLQAPFGYKLNPQKEITLHAGLGYRMRDAANLLLGMTKGNLRVGLAYDVNLSSLTTVSNYRGGWELAVNYIIKIYKPAVVKPKILCPRY
ncbi:MAG: PorP/SprF family type IX secretion system membrane protein [Saprospiraceae bacterium]